MEEINKNGQIRLNFESAETLARILGEVNDSCPSIKYIIEGRISYDGKFFYIDNKKDKGMTEEELKSFMFELNKYEMEKLAKQKEVKRKEQEKYEKNHPTYDWQRRKDLR
jgi:hypothetical protein